VMTVDATIPKDRTAPVVLELGLQYCTGTLQVRNVKLCAEEAPIVETLLIGGKCGLLGMWIGPCPRQEDEDRRITW